MSYERKPHRYRIGEAVLAVAVKMTDARYEVSILNYAFSDMQRYSGCSDSESV